MGKFIEAVGIWLPKRWLSVDLDIEGGGSTGYAAFITKIRSLASGASKPWVFPRSRYGDRS